MSIQVTTIKNGTLRLVLSATDEIDEATLKQLNGARARLVTDNIRILDKNVAGALIIELEQDRPVEEPNGSE